MSDGMNKAYLLGNLGADPDLRYTQGGQAVLSMRLATTETYLDKDKVKRERTDWHNVVCFGPRAEGLAKHLRKGSRILVEGSLRTSSYEAKDGGKRYKTEVLVQNVVFAGGNGSGAQDREEGGGEQRPSGSGASRGGTAKSPASGGAVTSDRDLDGKYGDPDIRFDPKKWDGASFKGRKFSAAPAAYLELLAEALDEIAAKTDDEKTAGYKRKDAERARGWARRNAGGPSGSGGRGQTAPDPGGMSAQKEMAARPASTLGGSTPRRKGGPSRDVHTQSAGSPTRLRVSAAVDPRNSLPHARPFRT